MSRPTGPQHLRSVESEFTRQADAFASSETLKSDAITARIGEALGAGQFERVLDVACGPGLLAPVLSPRAGCVVGIDFTAKPLALARARCRDHGLTNCAWLRGVVERTPLRSGSFDAAIVRLALHHFERPDRVLVEVRRLLRAGGRLVVLDILTSDDPSEARLHNSIERLRDPSHTSFWPANRLVEMIGDAGFGSITEQTWVTPRSFDDWAAIIADAKRMDALEVVLREIARAGVDAGIGLREQGDELWFSYSWGLFVATA